ncbi:DUF4974 domain-containing protein [Echinicola soli]|uniref:DUF4974 domain-containing protein n=1 Tax=Echinicola soli TaxID=2591634 RepID=A0A514CHX2_9BACT|nr:FecR domain-containing protein [Echinicola soli]QDH79415.1 DUF4974 domain-containing protein [Echinicola soli]
MSWVKNPSEESDVFWQKWLQNHPQSHDDFYRAKELVKQVHFEEYPNGNHQKEAILDKILKEKPSDHFNDGNENQSRLLQIMPVLLRATAACLIIMLAVTYIFSSYPVRNDEAISTVAFVTKENPYGQKTAFFLPDKSRVILNAGSKISFPETFDGTKREVFLEGEAYFDVIHDESKSFLVHSGDVVTQVHGTAFSVQAFSGEQIDISLERGLVSVYPLEQEKPVIPLYLKPGEMLTVHQDFGQSVKSTFDYDQQFGWKDGKLVFKGANISTVVKVLERWYGVSITVVDNPPSQWKVSGVFQQESLENVLEGIKYARNITYEIHESHVTIKTKP